MVTQSTNGSLPPVLPNELTEEWFIWERRRMEATVRAFKDKLSQELKDAIAEAYNLDNEIGWDWRTSNGCNFVDERYWPTIYFVPCVVHDYWCEKAKRAKTRREADRIRARGDYLFLLLNRAYGLPLWGSRAYTRPDGTKAPGVYVWNSSLGRFLGVRLGWWFGMSRRHVPKYDVMAIP